MLKPSNIKGKTFETQKNGYNQEEVNEYLSQVAADYAAVLAANQESEEKIMKLVDTVNEYRQDEDAIKMALLAAQKEANKILSEAKAKAKDMIESAKTEQVRLAEQSASECERIVKEHKEKCAQLIKENTELTQAKIQAIRQAYDEEKAAFDNLKAEVTYFKANLTGLYNEQIKLIMQIPEMTDEDIAAYEEQYIQGEEYTEEEAPAEEAVEEVPEQVEEDVQETDDAAEEETAVVKEAEEIDKILNTGSFEPVIPKTSFNDLKFGKNN